jgi:hypothetical protein
MRLLSFAPFGPAEPGRTIEISGGEEDVSQVESFREPLLYLNPLD